MSSVFLAPHNDDEVLFGSFLILRDEPDLVVCLRSHVQYVRGTGITHEMRERETAAAWAILRPEEPWTQWEYPDSSPPWKSIERDIRALAEEYDHCYAPAFERGGHVHHNEIGEIAVRAFGTSRTIQYLTYTPEGRSTWGIRVPVLDGGWIASKLSALSKYQSQIREPSTQPHFLGPQAEAVRNRTMKKDLAHRTLVEDSTRCSVASADYLLVFRRRGDNPVPVVHPEGLMEYAGSRAIPEDLHSYRGWTGNQRENRFSHWIWRQYASAFWDDVRIDRVLPFREARDDEDERHVHPLQLDVIDRCLVLWSNPGESVLTPFMGVGSEVYGAVRNGRVGVGVELKPSYYRQAVKNLEAIELDAHQETLSLVGA